MILIRKRESRNDLSIAFEGRILSHVEKQRADIDTSTESWNFSLRKAKTIIGIYEKSWKIHDSFFFKEVFYHYLL